MFRRFAVLFLLTILLWPASSAAGSSLLAHRPNLTKISPWVLDATVDGAYTDFLIVLDEQDRIVRESHQWAATPFTGDSEWRGPIMPGSRRYFVSHCSSLRNISPLTELRVEVEVTELRLWNRPEYRIPVPLDPDEIGEATASAAK